MVLSVWSYIREGTKPGGVGVLLLMCRKLEEPLGVMLYVILSSIGVLGVEQVEVYGMVGVPVGVVDVAIVVGRELGEGDGIGGGRSIFKNVGDGDGALSIRSRCLSDECRETTGTVDCWVGVVSPFKVGGAGSGAVGGGKGAIPAAVDGCSSLEGSGIGSSPWWLLVLLVECRCCLSMAFALDSISSGRSGRLDNGGGFGAIMDSLTRCIECRNDFADAEGGVSRGSWSGARGRAEVGGGRGGGTEMRCALFRVELVLVALALVLELLTL